MGSLSKNQTERTQQVRHHLLREVDDVSGRGPSCDIDILILPVHLKDFAETSFWGSLHYLKTFAVVEVSESYKRAGVTRSQKEQGDLLQ